MYRGTTPTHTFTVDADLTECVVMYVTYSQGHSVVVEKSIDDCTITTDSVTVTLTQEDTLHFIAGLPVRVQIRAGWAEGTRIASNILVTSANAILKDGAI